LKLERRRSWQSVRLLDSSIRTLRNYFSSTIPHSHDDRRYVINPLDQIPAVVARCTVHVSVQREH